MSESDNTTRYVTKFVENTTRVIGLTNSILASLKQREPAVAARYSDVPGLLDLAKQALVNMITPDMMEKLLIDFMSKAIDHLELLRVKDDSILTERLSIILPDSPYVERVQYLYGANPKKTRYCTDKEIQTMWLLTHALVHNAVKHIVNNKIEPYCSRILADGVIERWGVDFNK